MPKDVKWLELPSVAWVIVRNYNQFVETILRDGLPQTVSFDHDLADEHYQEYHAAHDDKMLTKGTFRYDKMKEKTGYHCAHWMAAYCVDKKLPIPVYYLHTMNFIGKQNMASVLESARRVIAEMNPKCQKCGESVPSNEFQQCPYEAEINDNETPCCNCCAKCAQDCANDI